MRKLIVLLCFFVCMAVPVSAVDYTAPEAPDSVQDLIPIERSSFGKDLWKVIVSAVSALQPEITEAAGICLSLTAVVMLVSLLRTMPGKSVSVVELAGTVAVAAMLLQSTGSLVQLAVNTVREVSEYGKLLLPVMAASMAAQGGITASASLYVGTAVFDALLSAGISKILIPMVYMFLALSVAGSATGEDMLKNFQGFFKWLITWCLKTILYIFTGYMGITGVVSGTTDAAALKATKLTMSGMIPVVGGILSDASEAVIVGTGVVKNTVGVSGMLAVIAICISPFLKIGVQYLLLKLTAAFCDMFGVKRVSSVIQAFSTAMGILLGMTGAVCILLLISTVCFMKGMG